MDSLAKFISDICDKTKILKEDIDRIMANKKMAGTKGDDKNIGVSRKPMNLKSFQPVTRLRKSKEDIIKAKENPELTFIMDKISDIFGGN